MASIPPMILLDTDVVIDIERGHAPALAWLSCSRDMHAALPGIVALELLQGARSDLESRRSRRLIDGYRLRWPSGRDGQRALDSMSQLRRSGMSVPDALIAQTAIGLGAPLATFNERHFRAVPGLTLVRPYER
jgi:predicted nucleic acid-binding protein